MWDFSRIPDVMTVSHLCQVCETVVGYYIRHCCFPSMSSMWNCCRIPDVMAVSHLSQVCGTVVGYHMSETAMTYVILLQSHILDIDGKQP
jgi:hypothetical protein